MSYPSEIKVLENVASTVFILNINVKLSNPPTVVLIIFDG